MNPQPEMKQPAQVKWQIQATLQIQVKPQVQVTFLQQVEPQVQFRPGYAAE
jgi:protoporphyrinogen oxidase